MFTFEYKNDVGTLFIGGGNAVWNATDVTGLGMVDKNVTSVTFSGEHGRLTTDAVYRERTITITGDITADNLTGEIERAVSILSHEGDIVINGKRVIHANSVSFPDPNRCGRFAKFTFQFVCDTPFFGETDDISVPVLGAYDNLTESFTLPMAFSSITTYGQIDVKGESETSPIIYITNLGDEIHDNITLINESTGKRISLNHFPEKYETVEIDIDKRSVKGSRGENLIHCLTPETRLSEFYLIRGENKIRLENNFENVNVAAKYKNRYGSAIY